jgi:hypothetical protein
MNGLFRRLKKYQKCHIIMCYFHIAEKWVMVFTTAYTRVVPKLQIMSGEATNDL